MYVASYISGKKIQIYLDALKSYFFFNNPNIV